jgi:hypothetical protein
MKLPEEVKAMFSEEMAAKFLATRNGDGKVNLAAIVSLQPPADGRDDRLIFGEFLMWKSRANLEQDSRVGAAVVNLKLRMASLTGDFRGFERKGTYMDQINSSRLFMYNAYTGVRQAGIVDVREVGPVRRASYSRVMVDLLALQLKRLFASKDGQVKGVIPPIVRQKFATPTSVKALAVIGSDGYPRVYPVMSVASWGKDGLLIKVSGYNRELCDLPSLVEAACCVLTMNAISYQVKGKLEKAGRNFLKLRAEEVYSSSPPLAGEKIYPRD